MKAPRLFFVFAAASGLVACNAIFGLDSLTYEPRPSIPLPPDDAALDGASEATTNDAAPRDAATPDTGDAASDDATASTSDAADDADATD